MRIGIVGCGAIGSSIAKAVQKDFKGEAKVCGLFDIDRDKAHKLAATLKNNKLVSKGLDSLILKSDLIVEATHAKFSYCVAQRALQAHCDVLIMSVGGVIDRYKELLTLAKRKKCRVYIPSGAICGIDGIKALSQAKIRSVTLTTRKPPKGFGLKKLTSDRVLFDGKARDAVKRFPQNINVAAALSLAGIGPDKTRVRIIASPKVTRNIHEIEIVSEAGNISTRTENVVHPENPKTSYLAVLSAVATLRQILNPVNIGT